MPERILIVEDEHTLRKNLARYLEHEGYDVIDCETAEAALDIVRVTDFAVALVDLRLPGQDGLSFATALSESAPETCVIVMTAYSSVDSVVEALRAGVHDYLIKPVMLREVGQKVAKLCQGRRLARENARLRRELAALQLPSQVVARSRVMRELLAFVRQVAPSNVTVLIEGESGSGKDVVARALHDVSPRRDAPFIAVNVAAIPEPLLESQLFGHARGAYTGAEGEREGLFRAAGRGTLFLDEIGEMPPAQQAKLLRAIETKEVLPVGADRAVRVEARIVAATNADLAQLVKEKRFRGDLYYRLAAIRVRVPPLRERPEDVPALAQYFLERHRAEHHCTAVGFDAAAMRRLLAHGWPGNVRELSNVVERATVVAAGQLITIADLPPELSGAAPTPEASYQEAMADFERTLIKATLDRVGGDRREAARVLGLSLATLYRRIDKLGIRTREPEERSEGPQGG